MGDLESMWAITSPRLSSSRSGPEAWGGMWGRMVGASMPLSEGLSFHQCRQKVNKLLLLSVSSYVRALYKFPWRWASE